MMTDDELVETIKAALWAATPDDGYKTEEDRAEADPWLARDAAAVLPIVRAQQAEAWDECADEAFDLGHLHGPACTEMTNRNPHRDQETSR